jgi:mandelate racemase
MTTIKDLRVRPVRVPMLQPHRTASGVITESPLVLTDAVMSDGPAGHSIMFTYTAAALGPTADLIRNLAPLIEGRPLAPADVTRTLAARLRLLGTQGLVGAALAAIDMALWDALARTRDTSLVRLLGAMEKPVPAYGAVGYDGETGSAVAAEDWAKRGFRAVKAKIGYPDVRQDLAVVRAMRQAVGDNVGIMVDYNQSLAPVEAVDRLRVLEGEGLIWVEEPALAHDHSGHAWIAREIRTPIQCGENWGLQDLRHAIDARASDYLMFDAARIGGVSGWQSAAALAETAGLRVSSHLWPELSAQLLGVTPTAHWLEYADWWNPIVAEPLRIDNGMAVVDSATRGAGVEWNEEAVSRCL